MSLSAVLEPNVYKMYEGTKFAATFSTDANNTYTDLGSMYVRSNDGAQITVICKFRIVGANAGQVATNLTLPVPADATLVNKALFAPTPLVVTSTGATTINLTNAVASNTASVVALTSSANPNGTYIVNLMFSYNVVAANN